MLLGPDHDRPELLGGQAAVVWEVLDEPGTAADIARAALALVPAVDDVDGAIDELRRLGLIDESS